MTLEVHHRSTRLQAWRLTVPCSNPLAGFLKFGLLVERGCPTSRNLSTTKISMTGMKDEDARTL